MALTKEEKLIKKLKKLGLIKKNASTHKQKQSQTVNINLGAMKLATKRKKPTFAPSKSNPNIQAIQSIQHANLQRDIAQQSYTSRERAAEVQREFRNIVPKPAIIAPAHPPEISPPSITSPEKVEKVGIFKKVFKEDEPLKKFVSPFSESEEEQEIRVTIRPSKKLRPSKGIRQSSFNEEIQIDRTIPSASESFGFGDGGGAFALDDSNGIIEHPAELSPQVTSTGEIGSLSVAGVSRQTAASGYVGERQVIHKHHVGETMAEESQVELAQGVTAGGGEIKQEEPTIARKRAPNRPKDVIAAEKEDALRRRIAREEKMKLVNKKN